jgi:hypothetical protein
MFSIMDGLRGPRSGDQRSGGMCFLPGGNAVQRNFDRLSCAGRVHSDVVNAAPRKNFGRYGVVG